MNLYMLDLENIPADAAFTGVTQLTEQDKIVIFYNRTAKITMELHTALNKCRADIEYIEISRTGKNYLDFQLVTYLGSLVTDDTYDECFIISNDKGFDSVVDFWCARNKKLMRQNSIKPAQRTVIEAEKAAEEITPVVIQTEHKVVRKEFNEQYRKKIREAVKPLKLSPSSYSPIYKAAASSVSTGGYHNALVQSLKDDGSRIYKSTKEIFEDFISE